MIVASSRFTIANGRAEEVRTAFHNRPDLRGRSTVRGDCFAALSCQAFDHFDGRRRTRAIATLYRSDIDATPGSKQRATPNKRGEHLSHRCPAARMRNCNSSLLTKGMPPVTRLRVLRLVWLGSALRIT